MRDNQNISKHSLTTGVLGILCGRVLPLRVKPLLEAGCRDIPRYVLASGFVHLVMHLAKMIQE